MNFFDIFIIVILVFFVWKGFRTGLVGAIGAFLGIIIGIWAGSHYMQQVSVWLMDTLNIDNEALNNILAFTVIFIAINIVASIIVSIVNQIFHIIPFINLIDKLLGAFIGLIGGVLAVAAIVYLLSLFPISDKVTELMLGSSMVDWASRIAFIIKPFIPQTINSIQSILENVN